MHPIIETYKIILSEVNSTILRFQKNCSHPDETLFKIMKASTGSWDRGDDNWWANFWCSVCDKYWTAYAEDKPYSDGTGNQDFDYRFRGIKVDKFPKDN
jgi:hypothetical protein